MKRWTACPLLLLAALASCQTFGTLERNEQAASQQRLYTAAEFHQTTSISLGSSDGVSFSPDSETVLISSDASGLSNVYELALNAGQMRQLTNSAKGASFAVSYFPKDRRVLFSSDGAGDELRHLYVRELDGSVRDLTPGKGHQAIFLGWSQNGDRFWVATNERDKSTFDVYAYESQGYNRKRVFQNSGFEVVAVSPNGRWLALVRLRTSSDFNIYLAELGTRGEPTLITPHTGDVDHYAFGFTPDSRKLLYRTDEFSEFREAWSHDIESGQKSKLLADAWDVSSVQYSPSGRYMVAGLNVNGAAEARITDLQTDQPITLRGLPPGQVSAVRFSHDETRVAVALGSDTSPTNIYVAELPSGNAIRLTTALNQTIREADLVDGLAVRYRSFDGIEIPAILYVPKQASSSRPAPAIVWIHGGPGGQFNRGYSAEIQHLVNHGHAVLAVNYRGSQGYGKTFYHLDDRRHGQDDLKDIVAAEAFLASRSDIDGDRIAVMGESYGGFLTASALAFSPDTFEAGIDIFGVTNWIRTISSFPPHLTHVLEWFHGEIGHPVRDAERLRSISPLFHASNIKKPLLVLQGANDPRVLKVESDELVAAVRANGVPVEYVVFPDEGHGFQRRENRVKASEAYLRFLQTHLVGRTK